MSESEMRRCSIWSILALGPLGPMKVSDTFGYKSVFGEQMQVACARGSSNLHICSITK